MFSANNSHTKRVKSNLKLFANLLKMPYLNNCHMWMLLLLVPSWINAAGIMDNTTAHDCHGKVCDPVDEYCSNFAEACHKCANICELASHNYDAKNCEGLCAEYKKFNPLQAEIHSIRTQQNIILILLIVLLCLIVIRYAYKCLRWIRHKNFVTQLLKKLKLRKEHDAPSGKDLGGTTIQNVMAINNDMERGTSHIYSVTGAEGSVMTMTTPVSTRHPAENSTTPTTIAGEYSYDNQALAITPVSEKPNNAHGF